mgnify:FL=1|tara:strand:+ start:422 stop:676 length:255 start_codon:yes stop_codon:yes gene_type:complete
MSQNKEDLKNKIIYRASYRGTKEMDILMTSFVKSSIDGLNMNELKQLSKLVNLEDELLISIRNKESNGGLTNIKVLEKFQKFNF